MTSSSFSFADTGRGPLVASGPACAVDAKPADGKPGCITCGDIAVEVEIVRLLPHAMAVVTTTAGDEDASIALVAAGVGDTILVHAGEAITVIRR